MENIADNGKTILFVSHDTQSIKKFCDTVIWLDKGEILQRGEPSSLLDDYMSFMSYGLQTQRTSSKTKTEFNSKDMINVTNCDSFGEKKALITHIGFFDNKNTPISFLKQGEFVKIICRFHTTINLYDVGLGVLFKDLLNTEIITFNSYMYDSSIDFVKQNSSIVIEIIFKVPKLYPKEYIVVLALSEGTQNNHIQQHWIHEATTINIISDNNIDNCIISLYPDDIKFKYIEENNV
jgi:lipopolysaccharide transport system ATP-binding protein